MQFHLPLDTVSELAECQSEVGWNTLHPGHDWENIWELLKWNFLDEVIYDLSYICHALIYFCALAQKGGYIGSTKRRTFGCKNLPFNNPQIFSFRDLVSSGSEEW